MTKTIKVELDEQEIKNIPYWYVLATEHEVAILECGDTDLFLKVAALYKLLTGIDYID